MSSYEEYLKYEKEHQNEYNEIDEAIDIEYLAHQTGKSFDDIVKELNEARAVDPNLSFDQFYFIKYHR